MGFHVMEFVLFYHSIVGLLVERDKFINLQLLRQDSTKAAMSIMLDEMINRSKDKRSLSCLISPHCNFIIPPNRVLGKRRYHYVLDQLNLVKNKTEGRKKRKI